MTKIISIFIVVLVLVAGWKLFSYYQQVAEEAKHKQTVETGADLRPDQLPGLPWELASSLEIAQKNGATGMRNWLKAYGAQVQDPRKAWIEMDYALALMREDPNEAKKVFLAVKERTPTNSPVYPRVLQLEKTF
ncbi:MAG TPA: hypothetical protein VFV96_10145 [Verrucomicrobiae bacterium]|nr:hypothetical protein [Verrucomicrobiae bacterium]